MVGDVVWDYYDLFWVGVIDLLEDVVIVFCYYDDFGGVVEEVFYYVVFVGIRFFEDGV